MSKQNNMRSLNWRQRGWRSVGWKNSDVTVEAPADSILHWDADIDAFSEQTSGPHTFEHAVLSPQYQLNADGSYTNVGAKPAVDTFDGEKWLRSCGAVENLLPSGAEDISGWGTNACTVSPEGSFYRLTATGTSYSYVRKYISAPTVGQKYTVSRRVKRGSRGFCTIGFHGHPDAYFNLDDLTYSFTGTGAVGASITDDGDGWRIISATWQYQGGTIYAVFFALASAFGSQSHILVGDHIYMSNPQLTATSYPVPYVPPGVTQPASNATTTNGSWFALPDGSPLWQALDGHADGVELVANDILKSTTGWDARSCTLFADSNGLAVTSTSSGSYGVATRTVTTVVGRRYEMLVRVKSLVSMSALALIGVWVGSATWSTASLVGAVGSVFYLKHRFTAGSPSTEIRLGCSNEVGASALFESISIQRIQPQPLTLATRVRMGVGSEDMPSGTSGAVVSVSTTGSPTVYFQRGVSGTVYTVITGDGVSFAAIAAEWPRNAVIIRVTQVNTAGTQFRVGYMIEGTHTAIQWGAWANYDGSFGPYTIYRLMLGYGNAYPMWFNKITAWKKQVTDAEILEAMA